MKNSSADYCRSAQQPFDWSDFPVCNGKQGLEYATWVSHLVSKFRNQRISLKNPTGATIVIGGLEDTIYKNRADEVNGWGKFYLPETVNMQVLGVLEGTTCPCEQLVLMTCEDKKLYAYDGDDLLLVASSLDRLRDQGIEYPASKFYYKGEAFKDMTNEDWDKVWKSPVGRRLDEEHHQLVLSKKPRFMKNLQLTKQRAAHFSSEVIS